MTETPDTSTTPITPDSSDKQKPTPNHRLRRERDRRMWSQQELADKVGTTPLNIGRWERGVTQPGPFFRQKLCEVFEKSPYELGLVPSRENDSPIIEQAQSASTITSSSTHPPVLTHWNVPYRRNLFFTGREDILMQLRDAFMSETSTIALAQTQAISGLGGIGKTQTAVEYAYRYRDNYQAVFWVRAESPDLLTSDYVTLAALLTLPERNEQDQSQITTAVIRWFDTHDSWLLILDNADELDAVSEYIPSAGKGHILLTTRAQAVGTLAQRIDIDKLSQNEGVTLLLKRIKRLRGNAAVESVPVTIREQAQAIVEAVDCLPLALDQAGAYIEETNCSLSDYLKFYKTRRTKLLRMRGHDVGGHPEPVAATWSLAFENVERANPAAADLLRLCVFLHPDAIPESMIIEGASELGPVLGPIAADELDLNEAIGQLLRYSLVKRDPDEKILNIHRLVQAVVRDGMKEDEERMWVERTVRMMNKVFPESEKSADWLICQHYLPHALLCLSLKEKTDGVMQDVASLSSKVGNYLQERAQHIEAEVYLRRSLAIRERLLKPDDSLIIESLNNLGVLYWKQGRYNEAQSSYQQAILLSERTNDPGSIELADSRNGLALIFRERGEYPQAEILLRQALAIREKILGTNHIYVAETMSNLALILQDMGKLDETETLHQRAIAIYERALGPHHPNTLMSTNNFATWCFMQGKYEQTEQLFQHVLMIQEQVLGENHPDVATTLNNLATLYHQLRQSEKVESLLLRSLAIRKQVLGERHPKVAKAIHNIATHYRVQEQYDKAEPLFQQALAIRTEVLGLEHPGTADTLHAIAILYLVQGRYDESQTLFRQALDIRERVLGKEHPETVNSFETYARGLRKMNRDAEADELEARAQAIRARQS